MKTWKSAIAIVLTPAFLLAAPATEKPDRVKVGEVGGEPVYGITHTQNFELDCKIRQVDGDGSALPESEEVQIWIDRNFQLAPGQLPKAENFRFAAGFPGGATFQGFVGAEAKVVRYFKNRCIEDCFGLSVRGYDSDGPGTLMNFDVQYIGGNNWSIRGKAEANPKDKVAGVCVPNGSQEN